MSNDLHNEPFDEGTLVKLSLFKNYLVSWLPVFASGRTPFNIINIFDFFAGPGQDINNVAGSPLIAMRTVVDFKQTIEKNNLRTRLFFNEYNQSKFIQLKKIVHPFKSISPQIEITTTSKDFQDIYPDFYPIMKHRNSANFLFIDQNGIKHVNQSIFQSLTKLGATDFLFFISSSYASRFCRTEEFQQYLNIDPAEIDQNPYHNIHRLISKYYKSQIPEGVQLFLAAFSIKKKSNIYGLIFGSKHVLGIEKFLRECWKMDPERGEANFDIDSDKINPKSPYVFPDMNKAKKIRFFEKDLKDAILNREITTNKEIFVYTLENGFLPDHARAIIKTLKKQGILPRQKLNISISAYKKNEEQIVRLNNE